ncbi:MAG TPA: hypothetical protein VLJ86_12780 [Ramlibacter sp.]|nr:hypothetical protein [Ramlibacter sp.]
MIHLASDPNASRAGWRPTAAQGGKDTPLDARRSKAGHAWPFLSREAQRPQAKDTPTDTPTPTRSDSGS